MDTPFPEPNQLTVGQTYTIEVNGTRHRVLLHSVWTSRNEHGQTLLTPEFVTVFDEDRRPRWKQQIDRLASSVLAFGRRIGHTARLTNASSRARRLASGS